MHPLLPVLALLLCVPAAKAAVLNGYVQDARTGEPLPYAAVCMSELTSGTATDKNGYYVLRPTGTGLSVVEFSAIGYRPNVCTLDLGGRDAVRCDIRLRREPIPMPGVTSSAARERSRREVDVGVRRLAAPDLGLVPRMIEPDLLRSFQSQPGVVAVSDFSSALYVRGGSPDQNAVLLDGAPMYNSYHLCGLFSTFNTDAVGHAELHAGAFPAEYGHAVSSVLDVSTRRGNSERFAGKWDVGLLTSRLVVEGPLPKGSFLVAGRRAYTAVATGVMARVTHDSLFSLPYYFYDLQGRADFDLSPRDWLSVSGSIGRDAIDSAGVHDTADFHWGSRTLSLKWRHVFAPGLVLTSFAGHGASDASLRYVWWPPPYPTDDRLRTATGSLGLRSDIEYLRDSIHTFLGGWEATLFDVRSLRTAETTLLWNTRARPAYVALHLGDKWRPWAGLLVQPGFRVEYFTSGHYVRVSPRLAAKYFLRDGLSVTAGIGRYYQYLTTPFPRDELLVRAPALLFQQMVPADSNLPPTWADHLMLGAEKWFANGLQLSGEAYYKRMGNLLETDLYFDPSGDPNFDPLQLYPFSLVNARARIRSGSGRAAGIDLLLRSGTGWVGYGLAVARRQFLGSEYYPIFDSRHSIKAGVTISLGRGWSTSLQWLLRTGFPYSEPVGWFQEIWIDPTTGERRFWWTSVRGEGLRYPSYHRLDAGVERSFRLRGVELTCYLEVFNVYARRNVLWYSYDNGVRKPFVLIPVPIPSLGVRGSF
jgi:hypothetical protein